MQSLSIYTSHHQNLCIDGQKIPLYKGRDNNRVLYISDIALKLSKSHNRTPMEIASGIASHFSASCGEVFRVQIVPPGSIYVELKPLLLAAWLQSIAIQSLENEEEVGAPFGEQGQIEEIAKRKISLDNSERLFAVQYAHARCCSLLLLAHREELIKLKNLLADTSENSQEQIPWLNHNYQMRLSHPAEGHLIAELVKVVDNLEFPHVNDSVNWEKAALDLSQAFEVFWRKCRIWGNVKISSLELAQARLGLVMATQSVLKFLLVNKLGIFAPLEL
ncbi:DALR anticodon-binding domain-containing protein [Nostoc sp. CCY0012]|uniref:DALR anticodon-binding domain-containing protein n=1 Tax=Nostoc sp. CCY0012 TaxID=1056123 RepID=UPI0039C5D495